METCTHTNVYNGVCYGCGLEVFATNNGTHIDMSSTFSEYHSYLDSNNPQPFESDLKTIRFKL